MADLIAVSGVAIVAGTPEADRIQGSPQNDTLQGNEGNDTIQGGFGDDVLYGGEGGDLLVGDVGADTSTGGAGADVFVLQINNQGIDIITDFNPEEDQLAFKDNLDPRRFEFQAGVGDQAGHTIVMDSITKETIAILLGVTIDATQSNLFAKIDRSGPTGEENPAIAEMGSPENWTVIPAPPVAPPPSTPLIPSPNPIAQPGPDQPEPPPILDLTGRLSGTSSSIATFGAGDTALNFVTLQPNEGEWDAPGEGTPGFSGWRAVDNDFEITATDGSYSASFTPQSIAPGEQILLSIDRDDFDGLGFEHETYLITDRLDEFTLNFILGGFENALLTFGDLTGTLTANYIANEVPDESLTDITDADVQSPQTWDEISFYDTSSWEATDYDFQIDSSSASQSDSSSGDFGRGIFVFNPSNLPEAGDRLDLTIDPADFDGLGFYDSNLNIPSDATTVEVLFDLAGSPTLTINFI